MIPSKNVWHPKGRAAAKPTPSPEPPDPADEDSDPVEPDEEPVSDADFLRSLQADVDGVREGTVQSMTDAMRAPLKDRPWGRRHKIRDKHGRAY
jgi:hypothetical protein